MLLYDHLVSIGVFIDLPLQVDILHILVQLFIPALLHLSLLRLLLSFPLAIFLFIDGSLFEILGEGLVHLFSLLDSSGCFH